MSSNHQRRVVLSASTTYRRFDAILVEATELGFAGHVWLFKEHGLRDRARKFDLHCPVVLAPLSEIRALDRGDRAHVEGHLIRLASDVDSSLSFSHTAGVRELLCEPGGAVKTGSPRVKSQERGKIKRSEEAFLDAIPRRMLWDES